jgi:glycerol kinase
VPELRVDGGAAVDDLLMQIQADLLGIPVVRPANIETTALGAAYLAGLATGIWRDQEDIRAHWHAERRFTPRLDATERESRYATWKRAVDRARGWAA